MKRIPKSRLILSGIVALLFCGGYELSGVDYTWVGGMGVPMNEATFPGNWTPGGGPPGGVDKGIINITANTPILGTMGGMLTPQSLSFEITGATFIVGDGIVAAPTLSFSGAAGTGILHTGAFTTTINADMGIINFAGTSGAGTGAGSLTVYNLSTAGQLNFSGSATGNTTGGLVEVHLINNSANIFSIAGGTPITIDSLDDNNMSSTNQINLGALLTLGNASDHIIQGVIANNVMPGSLDKRGTGKLTLNGTNAYTGPTTLSAGTLNISSDDNLGVGGTFTVADGTTLQAGAANVSTVRGFLLSGAGTNPTIDTQANDMDIFGVIDANATALGIRKIGTGKLTLTGMNTYTGGLAINGGTVNINADAALGTTAGQTTFGGVGTSTLQAGAVVTISSMRVVALTADGTFDTNGFASTIHGIITDTGALTVVGNGMPASSKLTLSGANSYTGGTKIGSSGGAQAATLALSGSGTLGVITGSLLINQNSVFDISGITGTVTIGSLTGATGSSINLGTAKTLIVNNTANTTFGGTTAASSGIFVKQGANTLTLTGNNNHNGGTQLAAGTLNISSDSNLGAVGAPFTIAGGNTLQAGASSISGVRGFTISAGGSAPVIDTQGNSLSMSGNILNGGTGLGVTKIGTGTFTLAASSAGNTFTGPFAVTQGTAAVDGILAAGATVSSGATLKGTGTINGIVTVNGTLQPGGSIGQQNYAGGLVLSSSSVLSIEINNAGQTSVANVTGSATITGSTLTITANPGTYTPTVYPAFLVTTTGVTGMFGTTNLPTFPDLVSTLIRTANTVQFALLSPKIDTANLAGITGNNRIVGNYLNSLPHGILGSAMVLLSNLSGSALNNALGLINPARAATPDYGSLLTGLAINGVLSNMVKLNIGNWTPANFGVLALAENEGVISEDELYAAVNIPYSRKKKDKKEEKKSFRNNLWAAGFGNLASQDSQLQTPGVDFTTGGVVVGYDYDYADAKRVGLNTAMVGVAAAYSHTGFRNKGHSGNGFTDSGSLAVYGTVYFDQFYLQLAAWNGYAHIHNKRNIFYPGYSQTATSSHNAYQGDLSAGFGYDYNFVHGSTSGTIEPFVLLDWVFNVEESYREKGAGVYNMRIKSRFSSMLRSEIGLNNYFGWNYSWGDFILHDKFSYVNRAPYGVGRISAQIIGAPNFFTVSSFTKNQSLFSPALELIWKGNNGWYGSILYEGEFGSGYISNELVGRLGCYF